MNSFAAGDTEESIKVFLGNEYKPSQLEPINADASFRSYWRATIMGKPYIIMDSPPELVDMKPFIQVGQWLESHGIDVPHIYKIDEQLRFLLLEDLGEDSLYHRLNHKADIATLGKPIELLGRCRQLERPEFLHHFTQDQFLTEARLFDEWCLARHDFDVKPGALEPLYALLAESAVEQPQGFVHRDYHSMNIHFTDHGGGVAMIDFQDGLWGPQTYDLVSILFDRYITWPESVLNEIIEHFRVTYHIPIDALEFRRQALWVSLQRNIRILGVFHRLNLRDNKPIYMNYVPRKALFCRHVILQYDELLSLGAPLLEVFRQSDWVS